VRVSPAGRKISHPGCRMNTHVRPSFPWNSLVRIIPIWGLVCYQTWDANSLSPQNSPSFHLEYCQRAYKTMYGDQLEDIGGTIKKVLRGRRRRLGSQNLRHRLLQTGQDEADHPLFVTTRTPGKLIVLDTDSDKMETSLPCVSDNDDLAYDSASKRIYISGSGTD